MACAEWMAAVSIHQCTFYLHVFPSQILLSSSLTSFPMNDSPFRRKQGQKTRFLLYLRHVVHLTALETIFLMKVSHLLSSEMSQVISAKTLIFGPAVIKQPPQCSSNLKKLIALMRICLDWCMVTERKLSEFKMMCLVQWKVIQESIY